MRSVTMPEEKVKEKLRLIEETGTVLCAIMEDLAMQYGWEFICSVIRIRTEKHVVPDTDLSRAGSDPASRCNDMEFLDPGASP